MEYERKGYPGNPPPPGWREILRLSDETRDWVLWQQPPVAATPWCQYKLVAVPWHPRKANYWVAWHAVQQRWRNRQDEKALATYEPEILARVGDWLLENARAGIPPLTPEDLL